MAKRFILLSLFIIMVFVFAYSGVITAQDQEKTVVVGYTPPSWHQSDLFPIIGRAIRDALEEWGHPYEFIQSAAGEPTAHEQQLRVVEDFIRYGVDYIVISATTPDAQTESIRVANEAGIPIIFVNLGEKFFDEEEYDVLAYVGDDHYVGGTSVKHFINAFLGGEGKIAAIYGAPGFVSEQRGEMPMQELREISNIEIIDGEYAHWDRSTGFRIAQDMITAHPDLDLIYSIASDQAMGAIEAVEAGGLEIPVIGFGATKEEVEGILDGRMLGSVLRDPFAQGHIAVDIIRMHFEGKPREEIPQVNPTPAIMLYTPELVYHYVPEYYWRDHVAEHGKISSGFEFDPDMIGDLDYNKELILTAEWIDKWRP